MVFEHILWMFVCLRLLGCEPAAPSPGMTLFAYAAELEIQHCRLCVLVGAAATLYTNSRVSSRSLGDAHVFVMRLPTKG